MLLPISPFPNRFPVGPYPSFFGLSVSPTKILLEYLGSFRLLSSRVAQSFQWVPEHAGLPGNERADSLTKTRPTLSFTHVPCLLAPTIAKIRLTALLFVETKFSHKSLSCQISSVSSEELALPRLIRCELSRLRCHGHSFLLFS